MNQCTKFNSDAIRNWNIFPFLTTFSLENINNAINDDYLISIIPNIEELNISNSGKLTLQVNIIKLLKFKFKFLNWKVFSEFEKFQLLNTLNLSHHDSLFKDKFFTFPKLPLLHTIFLENCNLQDNILIKILEDLTESKMNLKSLNLSDNKHLTDISIQKLCTFQSKLEYLRLEGCINLTDSSIPYICKLPLKLLDLDNVKITSESIDHLTFHCRTLISLSLANSPTITNQNLQHLLRYLIHLQCLDLWNCSSLSDAIIPMFYQYSRSIRYLNIKYCPAISLEAITSLIQKCSTLIDLKSNFKNAKTLLKSQTKIGTSPSNRYSVTASNSFELNLQSARYQMGANSWKRKSEGKNNFMHSFLLSMDYSTKIRENIYYWKLLIQKKDLEQLFIFIWRFQSFIKKIKCLHFLKKSKNTWETHWKNESTICNKSTLIVSIGTIPSIC